MEKAMNLGRRFLEFLDKRVEEFGGAQYRTFGVFGIISFPLGYIMLHLLGTDESAIARLLACTLCVPLIFTNHWPLKIKRYLNLYWFLTLLYCLPVFGVYTLLKNQVSTEWLMNLFLGLFLLFLLVDYVLLLLIYALGIVVGFLIFKVTGQEVVFQEEKLINYLYMYGWIILIGCIFSRRKEILESERVQALKSLAGAVAHEMRTPLLNISSQARRLKSALPVLVEEYLNSIKTKTENRQLSEQNLTLLNKTPDDIQKTTRQAFGFIDLTLMNLKEDFKNNPIAICSIRTCVEDALQEYNLSDREKSFLLLDLNEDFRFKGNDTLMRHVFFNLLKNSIYYVKAANKGDIIIKTAIVDGRHTLSFKDTGTGIAPEILPYIFDKFYSRTKYGTGIGLSFCSSVMKSLGGDITCKSHYCEYTEFILTFPPLEKT
jgi:signal transduction histidine kinase